MVVTCNTGLAHTYPDILEKGDYFLRRLDRIPFMYDIVVFESNLRFRPSTRKKILKRAFSKNSFLETGFENLHFWCPKRYIRVDGSLRRKLSSFSKISGYV